MHRSRARRASWRTRRGAPPLLQLPRRFPGLAGVPEGDLHGERRRAAVQARHALVLNGRRFGFAVAQGGLPGSRAHYDAVRAGVGSLANGLDLVDAGVAGLQEVLRQQPMSAGPAFRPEQRFSKGQLVRSRQQAPQAHLVLVDQLPTLDPAMSSSCRALRITSGGQKTLVRAGVARWIADTLAL